MIFESKYMLPGADIIYEASSRAETSQAPSMYGIRSRIDTKLDVTWNRAINKID